jgi:acylphosphatase
MSDGRVEVVACGGLDAIEKLVQWLSLGPPVARVTGVERCPVDAKLVEGLQDFEAR